MAMHTPCEHPKTCGDCLSQSHAMDLENTIKHATDALAQATEYNLATLSELKGMKSSSKSRIRRQQSICGKMLRNCADLYDRIVWGDTYHPKYPRVREILDAAGFGPTDKKEARSIDAALNTWLETCG